MKKTVKKIEKAAAKQSVEAAPKKHVRPSWDEYFMNIAELIGSRATCARGRSGCVIVRDRQILVTGYVGSPVGMPHCDEVGHEMHKVINDDGTESEHCIRTVHAEQNAIAQAAKLGVAVEGATLYCHMVPCYVCGKILVNAGIKKIIANKDYHASAKTKKLFTQAGVDFIVLHNTVENYSMDPANVGAKNHAAQN
jgi:dCMP deaminase